MPNRVKVMVVRYVLLLIGLFLLSMGTLLSVKAHLGVSAWTVFHLGIAQHIGWTQGQVSQVVGLIIVASSYFLGIKPAIATVLNMVLVGGIYDRLNALNILPTPSHLVVRCLFLALSVVAMGTGTALYISVKLGAGPRDSLMLALAKRTGGRIAVVRNSIEVGVLALGTLLGGPFGIGTLLYALTIGPVLEADLNLLRAATSHFHWEHYLSVMEPRRRTRPAEQPAVASNDD